MLFGQMSVTPPALQDSTLSRVQVNLRLSDRDHPYQKVCFESFSLFGGDKVLAL